MKEWISRTDPSSGRRYNVNKKTNAMQWLFLARNIQTSNNADVVAYISDANAVKVSLAPDINCNNKYSNCNGVAGSNDNFFVQKGFKISPSNLGDLNEECEFALDINSVGSASDSKIEPRRFPKKNNQSKPHKSDSDSEHEDLEEIDLTKNKFHFKNCNGGRVKEDKQYSSLKAENELKDKEIAELKRSLFLLNEKLNSSPDYRISPNQAPHKSVSFAIESVLGISTATPASPAAVAAVTNDGTFTDDLDTKDLEEEFLRSKKFKKMVSQCMNAVEVIDAVIPLDLSSSDKNGSSSDDDSD